MYIFGVQCRTVVFLPCVQEIHRLAAFSDCWSTVCLDDEEVNNARLWLIKAVWYYTGLEADTWQS